MRHIEISFRIFCEMFNSIDYRITPFIDKISLFQITKSGLSTDNTCCDYLSGFGVRAS